MIFFGRRQIRIKKYIDDTIKCKTCSNYSQLFAVHQEYFHVMFVPFFPSSLPVINCICTECGDPYNSDKNKDYLEKTKTPFWMYSGLILVGIFAVWMINTNLKNKSERKTYLHHPQIGDVYKINEEASNETIYYFLKINRISGDTMHMLHSALEYHGFVSEMDKTDSFVEEFEVPILKSKLKQYLDSGMISSIVRK